MAKRPIIFAMANPEPEIYPDEVFEVRDDAIMATGRSDFPNQVNNVLGFPFIFRGALDVRATKINMEMKLAAVNALAQLAREEVPQEVRLAYDNEDFTFGPNYLIPKPFDTRVLTRVTPAVAKAAMDSGVAKLDIPDLREYASNLEARLGTTAIFMKRIRDRLKTYKKNRSRKISIVFAEGANSRVLQAAQSLFEDGQIEPILLGKQEAIRKEMKKFGIDNLGSIKIINPEDDEKFEKYFKKFCEERRRYGVNMARSIELMSQRNYFGSMMVREKRVDAFLNGPTLSYPKCFVPIMHVIGTEKKRNAAGIYIMVYKDRVLFLADCTAQIEPSHEDLSEIAVSSAQLYRTLMQREPRIAFLSFSNFGSNHHKKALNVKKAVEITKVKYPQLICDGEMQADVATNSSILKNLFNFSTLDRAADLLIFPDLSSANISYKLLTQLSDTNAIGPILVPMNNTVNIIPRTATVMEIVNMSIVTAVLSENNS